LQYYVAYVNARGIHLKSPRWTSDIDGSCLLAATPLSNPDDASDAKRRIFVQTDRTVQVIDADDGKVVWKLPENGWYLGAGFDVPNFSVKPLSDKSLATAIRVSNVLYFCSPSGVLAGLDVHGQSFSIINSKTNVLPPEWNWL